MSVKRSSVIRIIAIILRYLNKIFKKGLEGFFSLGSLGIGLIG